ncbi:hypothetical protein CGZ88_0737 [Bifidobacterium anseris]|uniref:Uncharacterized protein n=1 Tax=Bifidobacterium anseris TaxID=2020963 RepID=A0A2N5J2X8_9BIFI|nr:hypothetical protein [Bifidobacterium anseris]PLS28575.1 hypothetical protein CGZ88_0737 [Bifidobacterium anseris]
MGYAITMCVVALAAFAAIAYVLGRDNGEREERYFAGIDADKQDELYRTPIIYDDDKRSSWHQKGIVNHIDPKSDGTADVRILWYNAHPSKTARKTETGVDKVSVPQQRLASNGVKEGDIVRIAVRPDEGVSIDI